MAHSHSGGGDMQTGHGGIECDKDTCNKVIRNKCCRHVNKKIVHHGYRVVRKRRLERGQIVDFGPHERLARGEVIVEGGRWNKRGRVASVIHTFSIAEQEAATWLEIQFEIAQFNGFHCSTFNHGGGCNYGSEQTERSTAARRQLWKVYEAIGPRYWNILFHVLFFMEPQIQYAIRAGIKKREVRPLLQAALAAVASYRAD